MGVSGQFIATSSSIADGAVSETKLAAQACSAAKMKKEGNAGQVLTSNGAGSIPSYQDVGAATAGGGSPILIIPFTPDAVIAGTWVSTQDTSYAANNYFTNTSNNQNDEFTYKVYLMAGTWTIEINGQVIPSGAITTVSIDASSVGTMDWYAAGSSYPILKSITGVTVASGGIKTVSFKAATRNASSNGWASRASTIRFVRTA